MFIPPLNKVNIRSANLLLLSCQKKWLLHSDQNKNASVTEWKTISDLVGNEKEVTKKMVTCHWDDLGLK